jgi:fucose 4-O-acetylase-like acetyltransferase
MTSAKSPAVNRVIFFDNLRFSLVLCVVLQHSSNAYSNLIWWPVADNDTSTIVDWLRAFIDAFAMPLLFYIAGYFALPTIQKKGVALFLKGKLKRLGIPGLLKFGIVSALSILCSYIVCQFLIKPFPRISVVVVIIMFVIMASVIHP